jgi:hypothetical protein
MKKLALVLALMLIPCSAFGLEMLDDNSMDGITGQAGVYIAVDDIQVFLNIEKMAWIDCDGFSSWEGKGTCGGAPGAIVLNNFQIDVLNINAITTTSSEGTVNNGLPLASTTCGDIPLFYNYATSGVSDGCMLQSALGSQTLGLNNYYGKLGDNSTFVPHFLTIDVTDELPASTEGLRYWANHLWTSGSPAVVGGDGNSTIGGVLIGVPTVEIFINQLSFTPRYDGDINCSTSTAINDDSIANTVVPAACDNVASFGTIYLEGITFTPLSGWIEIAPK